jgi:tetratricopeptide (TPR) repeat protein
MLDEGKKALERFSKHTNDRGRLYNMWGYYYSKTGDFQKAITAFEKSVRMNASLFDAYRNLGLMYLKVGKHDQARQAFEKSLSENPKQPKLMRLMEEKGWS